MMSISVNYAAVQACGICCYCTKGRLKMILSKFKKSVSFALAAIISVTGLRAFAAGTSPRNTGSKIEVLYSDTCDKAIGSTNLVEEFEGDNVVNIIHKDWAGITFNNVDTSNPSKFEMKKMRIGCHDVSDSEITIDNLKFGWRTSGLKENKLVK